MTTMITNILASLIAMAIWSILAFGVRTAVKRFRDDEERHRSLLEVVRRPLPEGNAIDLKQDLYMSLTILLNQYQRRLSTLIRGRIGTIITGSIFFFYTIYYSNNPSGYGGSIILLLYMGLAGFESYEIERWKSKLKELEEGVVEGISLRRKSLLKEPNRD